MMKVTLEKSILRIMYRIILEISSFATSKSDLTLKKVRFWSAFMSKFGQKKVRIFTISVKNQ